METSKSMGLRLVLLAILSFLIDVGVSSAYAQSMNVERDATTIFDTVMSPYCPGRTLSACPSDDARLLREEITQSLQVGSTIEEEKERLIRRFGPTVLGRPTGAAFTWSWGVPLLFLGVGLALITFMIRRRAPLRATTDEKKTSVRAHNEPTPAQLSAIENEVRKKMEGR